MSIDLEIAQAARPRPIEEIAATLGLEAHDIIPYGQTKAKVRPGVAEEALARRGGAGKLVLVTAINPTPAGEGKTTTTIGLADALRHNGEDAMACVREPSLGPCFGLKGGATGGGYAQVLPMEEINLHFTGDFHAVTSAHNLLSAMLDNHLYWGNALKVDPERITWRRVMDMNDRALRQIAVGLGGRTNGVTREAGFDITVASEVMAILCLASGPEDLKTRLGEIVVGTRADGSLVRAADLEAHGAMAALLEEAMKPNLVQTLEGTPVFVHGGPFANIAHGCNSLLATRTALGLCDYVVTEAGFGADLGAEKFFDIKCRKGNLTPAVAVVVATVRALKMHGGVPQDQLGADDASAVTRGATNLARHVENLRKFGVPVVVAINRFTGDSEAELEAVSDAVSTLGVRAVLCEHWAKGGAGAAELAEAVVELAATPGGFRPLYEEALPLWDKIERVARSIYRAETVRPAKGVLKMLEGWQEQGFGALPVCMAKTPASFSTDPKLLGAPEGFEVPVREVRLSAGAGFVVALTGEVMTMPGLPRRPSAQGIDIVDGRITGLF